MKPRKAKLSEAKAIHEMIMQYAKKDQMLPRAVTEIYEHIRDFFVVAQKDKLIGCCALHIDWLDLAEVKALAVAEKSMGKGIGASLVRECLHEAKQIGIKRVFVLTNKPLYFKKLGFSEIAKEELPQKVWGECVKCAKFPDCDETALIHQIT
ncbi:MAG TPA: N-acetyltransferase [bacterium]|nr:N-acetyltransferase [bacterium]